ncbi:MAG: toll/interleukin-1 receptor domain-containing protein [Chthoniobacter sp.]|uniref:toll/interleukin-1 receptor domain-containing protein n=1 Tax=Chthoniobacter sp. TaxID=2510640 RepID=UPI0032A657D7
MREDTKKENTKTQPLVFISYSHDSEDHKTWVRELATALLGVGINVILDQWEIGPGDEVPKFMEQSVRRAGRVIMICTEQYVRKVDDGKGGAGYEAMVVTSELVQDLGTRKFIPLIRQSGEKGTLPACVSTRYFVDFSKDALFTEKLEELARNIQDAPRFEKPPLGRNPFTAAAPTLQQDSVATDEITEAEPFAIYERALAFANAGDFAKWRELIQKQRSDAARAILLWKENNQSSFPTLKKDLPGYFLPAVATHGGLFAAAFGVFDSKDERFHNQLSLLDTLRKPKGWERGGNTFWVMLPDLVLFAYQALLGALALSRHRPEIAYNLAVTPIAEQQSGRDAHPLFRSRQFIGWPDSLEHTCTLGWTFLQMAVRQWNWLWKLFGSEEDTLAAIIAYYLFINTVDFVSATKAARNEDGELRELNPPLFIRRRDDDAQMARRACSTTRLNSSETCLQRMESPRTFCLACGMNGSKIVSGGFWRFIVRAEATMTCRSRTVSFQACSSVVQPGD